MNTTTEISFEEVKAKCISGEYVLKKKNGKSEMWKKFSEISDAEGTIIKNFVICSMCKRVYPYSSHKSGTSNLLKHKCVQQQNTMDTFVKKFNKSAAVTTYMKELVTEKCVNFIVKDLRPFEIVAGEGLADFAQCLVDIGVKYGNIKIQDLLPHPTTISRNTKALADKLRNKIKEELQHVFEKIGGAITVDMWTDDYRKINYLGVTVHYIKNFKLIDRVLCTTEFDSNLKKTGENIKNLIIQVLREFAIYDSIKNLVFITDRGTNIIAALKSYSRLNCAAHVLNTVLEHTMRPENMGHISNLVENTIVAVRALVTYFKRSGLQNKLKVTLKGDSETRWNSKLLMFSSVFDQWDEILNILSEKEEMQRVNNIDKDILNTLINFLKPFKIASDQLEGSTYPTLYLVIVNYKRLLNHLTLITMDSDLSIIMKRNAKNFLQAKLEINMLHKIAVFLHPKLKSSQTLQDICNMNEENNIHGEVRKLMCKFNQTSAPESQSNSTAENTSTNIEPPTKKVKHLLSLSEFEDSDEEIEKDELSKYLDLRVSKTNEFNLLQWWEHQSTILPTLSKVASFIHAIPATSAPSERDFSQAGLVIQNRRTSLAPSTVNDILFLHSNIDK